jgi:hypothetical protein
VKTADAAPYRARAAHAGTFGRGVVDARTRAAAGRNHAWLSRPSWVGARGAWPWRGTGDLAGSLSCRIAVPPDPVGSEEDS